MAKMYKNCDLFINNFIFKCTSNLVSAFIGIYMAVDTDNSLLVEAAGILAEVHTDSVVAVDIPAAGSQLEQDSALAAVVGSAVAVLDIGMEDAAVVGTDIEEDAAADIVDGVADMVPPAQLQVPVVLAADKVAEWVLAVDKAAVG